METKDTQIEGLEEKLIYWRYTPPFAAEVAELLKRQELIDLIPAVKALQEDLRDFDLRGKSVCELAALNPSVKEYVEHWEGRALKAEDTNAAQAERIGELEKELRNLALIIAGETDIKFDRLDKARALLQSSTPAESQLAGGEAVAELWSGLNDCARELGYDFLRPEFAHASRALVKYAPNNLGVHTAAPAIKQQVAEGVSTIQSALKLLEDGSYGAALECLTIYRDNNLVPNRGWCDGCSPDNCSGCGFGPTHPVSANQPDSGKVEEERKLTEALLKLGDSVLGDCYLGEEEERKLVMTIRALSNGTLQGLTTNPLHDKE